MEKIKRHYPIVYTFKEVSEILGKGSSYVYKLFQRKKIKAFNFGWKAGWRVTLPNLKKYIDSMARKYPNRIFSYGERLQKDLEKQEPFSHDIYNFDEVCEILHISKDFLYRLLRSGRIKGFKFGLKGGWRVPNECLLEFMEKSSQKK